MYDFFIYIYYKMLSSPYNKLQEQKNKLMQQQQIINQIKAIKQKRILNYRARCIKLQKERQSQQSLEEELVEQ